MKQINKVTILVVLLIGFTACSSKMMTDHIKSNEEINKLKDRTSAHKVLGQKRLKDAKKTNSGSVTGG